MQAKGQLATGHIRLLLGASIVAAGAAVAATLFYLWLTGAPMRPAVVLVATVGVAMTVLVAGGLMTLIYYSNDSGHDRRAGGANLSDIAPIDRSGVAPRHAR